VSLCREKLDMLETSESSTMAARVIPKEEG
jgi:hypothetical protein